MGIDFSVEQREAYSVVRLNGDPSLDEFLSFIEALGAHSSDWPTGRVLCDLRNVRTLRSPTEHEAVGAAVGRHLGHLRQVASVVPADRITRTSEKAANRAGVNLKVFTSEGEAIEWLTGAAPAAAQAGAPE